MGKEIERQVHEGENVEPEEPTRGVPLGFSANPAKQSHQQGNKDTGILNWRAGRGQG